MSRCFPYPPPGFNGKKASDALIDSIKLQKDKEKAETERKKEKKRQKKEKKREKKEKKETAKFRPTEIGHSEYPQKDGKKIAELEGKCNHKRKQEESEQLENSGVTEEHGQPLTSLNPSYSSDGTQNSNKRTKQNTDSRGHGNIIRIKLPLQKRKEPEATISKDQLCSTLGRNLNNKQSYVLASSQQHCSTSGRIELLHNEEAPPVLKRKDLHNLGNDFGRTYQRDLSSLSKVDNSLPVIPPGLSIESGGCSTSGNKGVLVQDVNQIISAPVSAALTSRERKLQKKSLKYDNLIQNLYQITLPSVPVQSDDEDWLFRGKCSERVLEKRNTDVAKQSSVASNGTCSSSSTLYPRARYLPEADIYALPYTVPF